MKITLPESCPVGTIAESLGLKTQAAKEFLRYALENTILMDKKQQDYGSNNISKFGLFGVIVRMSDKIERLKNLKYAGLTPAEKTETKRAESVLNMLAANEHKLSLMEMVSMLDTSLDSIRSLVGNRRKQAVNESIEDTFRDVSNYAIIALLLESKKWPEE